MCRGSAAVEAVRTKPDTSSRQPRPWASAASARSRPRCERWVYQRQAISPATSSPARPAALTASAVSQPAPSTNGRLAPTTITSTTTSAERSTTTEAAAELSGTRPARLSQ
jgi:hypothetical protein